MPKQTKLTEFELLYNVEKEKTIYRDRSFDLHYLKNQEKAGFDKLVLEAYKEFFKHQF